MAFDVCSVVGSCGTAAGGRLSGGIGGAGMAPIAFDGEGLFAGDTDDGRGGGAFALPMGQAAAAGAGAAAVRVVGDEVGPVALGG